MLVGHGARTPIEVTDAVLGEDPRMCTDRGVGARKRAVALCAPENRAEGITKFGDFRVRGARRLRAGDRRPGAGARYEPGEQAYRTMTEGRMQGDEDAHRLNGSGRRGDACDKPARP